MSIKTTLAREPGIDVFVSRPSFVEYEMENGQITRGKAGEDCFVSWSGTDQMPAIRECL